MLAENESDLLGAEVPRAGDSLDVDTVEFPMGPKDSSRWFATRSQRHVRCSILRIRPILGSCCSGSSATPPTVRLEIPAGRLDPGESPEDARTGAARGNGDAGRSPSAPDLDLTTPDSPMNESICLWQTD